MIPVRNCHKTIKYTRDEVVRFDQNSYLQAVRDTPIARVTGCVSLLRNRSATLLSPWNEECLYIPGSTGQQGD